MLRFLGSFWVPYHQMFFLGDPVWLAYTFDIAFLALALQMKRMQHIEQYSSMPF